MNFALPSVTTALIILALSSGYAQAEGKTACEHGAKHHAKQQGEQLITEEQARTLVTPFYQLLSGDTTVDKVQQSFMPDWKSYSGREKYLGLDDTLGFISGPLQKMVPDLNWEIVDVSVTNDNEIIVRGEASGTPVGETFMGQTVTGKGFKMMSIDIHNVKDGKISQSYHIEDWRGAFAQMAADQ